MGSDGSQSQSIERTAAQFATTHWSTVLRAGDTASPDSREALEKLCRTYWFPLYAFVRRKGFSPEDAQDLTQEFFGQLLEKHRLRLANPVRGKFRSFLLASMVHFLVHEWDRLKTIKRGANFTFVSWDELGAEQRYGAEVPGGLLPDQAFDQQWALALLETVLGRLRDELTSAGRAEFFECARPWLLAEPEPGDYARAAVELGMTHAALKMAMTRLRRRYGDLLRQEIAQTVSTVQQVEEELRHLIEALSGAPI
jgi:DNA-directed RNA polymerase specialized sigma24 family protein